MRRSSQDSTPDYRQEARDIRAKAGKVRAGDARRQLLLIASLYDKLADLTETLIPSLHAKIAVNSRMNNPTDGTDPP